MPRKNTVYRLDASDSYYHVYNRGVAKMDIFRDEEDYSHFEDLISKLLSPTEVRDKNGHLLKNYSNDIAIHAYCLMPNHFHFLIHQKTAKSLGLFIKSLTLSYSMRFNKKYGRAGNLLESRYKSVLIERDEHLMQVSRYIHLNPLGFRSWDHSSYSDYLYEPRPWITTSTILDIFRTKKHYVAFMDDYKDNESQADDLAAIFGDN